MMGSVICTTYKIVGKKEVLRSIYRTLQYMKRRKTPVVKNTWGKMWTGCFITKMGGSYENYECGEEIAGFGFSQKEGVLSVETWCNGNGELGLKTFLTDLYPNLQIFYFIEDKEEDYLVHNDPEGRFFPERYLLDCFDDLQYFNTLEETAAYISHIVGHELPPNFDILYETIDEYIEHHYDDDEIFYSLHEIEVVDD